MKTTIIFLFIWIIESILFLLILRKYNIYKKNRHYLLDVNEYFKERNETLISLTPEEKEVLKQSLEEHARLLIAAFGKETNKQKKAKYLLTRNTMLDIQKKLEGK